MSWDGRIGTATWDPKRSTGTNKITSNYEYLNVSHLSTGTITAESIVSFSSIQTQNLSAYNSYLPYLSNINILTNLVTLDGQGLTATSGGLYLNGNLIGTPSTISSIADWSRYKAQTDVDMAQSTIKNALGISSLYLSTSLIKCDTVRAIGGQIDTLYGDDQIYYPKGYIGVLSNDLLNGSTINADTVYSQNIFNEFEISSFSVYADQVNAHTINNYYSDGIFNGNLILGTTARLTNQLVCRGISTINISTNTVRADYVDTNALYTPAAAISTLAVQYLAGIDTLVVNKVAAISSLRANRISTATLYASNIFACNVNFDSATFNNIYANNTFTNNLTASNDTTLQNLTANGTLTFNNDLAMNGNVTFPTNTVYSELYPEGLVQFQKDINNLRNLSVEKITVLGGSTGNEFDPLLPFRNDSIIEVGEDILSPAQLILNGFNPDPADLGIALTVRGDAQIVQNLNVFGLTTLEGDVNVAGAVQIEGEFNVAGYATFELGIDVGGVGTFEGAVNIVGALGVEGETNLAGAVTCEAGIGVAGAVGLTGGDVSFGNSIDVHTFNNYYNTTFHNDATVNGNFTNLGTAYLNNVDISGVLSLTDISAVNINASNISAINVNASTITTNRVVLDASGNAYIYFNDLSGNLFAEIGRAETDSNILSIAALSNIQIGALGKILIQSSDDVQISAPNYSLSNSLLTINQVTLNNSNGNAYVLVNDSNSTPLGFFGRSESDNETIVVGSTCNLLIGAQNTAFISATNGIGLLSDVGVQIDATTYITKDIQAFSTITMNSNSIVQLSNISYVDYITTCNMPTYVGGQIQHWNPVGGYYDFYYSQLYYTDEANAANDGVDGYSNHRAIAQDWSYYKCENINLDMGGNYIANCAGLSIGTLYVEQAAPSGSGYIDAGVAFSALTGDTYWYQFVKPEGSEGIFIVQRNVSDGIQNQIGRVYDDVIYSPWANVTADLNMTLFSIIFKDQSTSIEYGINFNNNFLQYTQIGSGSRYVAQDWPYFPAEHYVDMSFNDIKNVGDMSANNVEVLNNFTYSNILQPVIQHGIGNTDTTSGIVTLPQAYPTSNYTIQLTYKEPQTGNKPVYVVSQTADKFEIHGNANQDVYWTTFGN